MSPARYLMVGGFLGAGKTTALLQLAHRLQQRGLRVGLITNDQSIGLVDTELADAGGFAVEEITGGCFCCRFDDLTEAAVRLKAKASPDVFLAEPVGSCTDLVATVAFPLRRSFGSAYSVAPYSVLIDPALVRSNFDLDGAANFSEKVRYIYAKQLEEAEVLVVNKCDLLERKQLDELTTRLRSRFPRRPVFAISARQGAGIDEWLDHLLRTSPTAQAAMEVDYDAYAEGEALLGWLNGAATLSGPPFDGNELLLALAGGIAKHLAAADVEIAHLKMTLTADDALAALNQVRTATAAELSQALPASISSGELILNLRAEADPALLRDVITRVLDTTVAQRNLRAALSHLETFRPGRPTPTHRLAGV